MPVLTCGGMRYQHSWSATDPVPEENQSNLELTMHAALERGIVHFETARGYGTSEKQMGRLLPKLPRDQIIVQTKIAPTADPNRFEADVRDSLQRLNLPWVDLLALHGVNDENVLQMAVRPGGCLDRALQLKAQGVVRHVGFSCHAPENITTAAIEDGRFEYVNLHYYWAMQDNANAVRQAAARDMGVLIISPNDKGGHLYNPPRKLSELTSPLSPMIYNDLWCLAHSDVHTLSIGVRSPSDFDEHVGAVELLAANAIDPRSLVAPTEARLQRALEQSLGSDWANTWASGVPPWQQMPGQINAREILRLYNMAVAYDMLEYGRSRYNLLGNGGHWFPGKTARGVDTLDLTRALQNSPHAGVIPKRLSEAHTMLAGEQQQRLQKNE